MNAAALASLGRGQMAQPSKPDLFRRIRAYLVGRRIQRRTYEELSMTNDRELADLGLSRFDVPRLAALAGRQAAEKYLAS
ncbi:DUF1127 domain-containing protein [Paracoccus sp. MBLB3053]|uniref:DUF1127 domain-containing protein n=1 Tax=Paracoccus aurantius TaxID=3073814 RepID=A0ABU2HY54_9RHOB|nr:DUF1127 domain-containing protein [Paracoccus sp. MBLB3053]MDS9469956.1 DUF1127 domain-containing protein [Paracoccus sp. MBLB3053]